MLERDSEYGDNFDGWSVDAYVEYFGEDEFL